jgi:hypothetical protein
LFQGNNLAAYGDTRLFFPRALLAGGGGDPRSLEIEIRRLNSELKSLKSSKMEQESSLRAQNDRIQKLAAKCASISCTRSLAFSIIVQV